MDLLSIVTYLNITKTFHLINSKNIPGELYATTAPWLVNNTPVNLTGNVLIDFLKNVASTVHFSVSRDAVPYF